MNKIFLSGGILVFLVVISCAPSAAKVECVSQADCKVGGCSGQLCVSKETPDVLTTCEFKPEYECVKLTSCGCVQGKCQWKENEEYQRCRQEVAAS